MHTALSVNIASKLCSFHHLHLHQGIRCFVKPVYRHLVSIYLAQLHCNKITHWFFIIPWIFFVVHFHCLGCFQFHKWCTLCFPRLVFNVTTKFPGTTKKNVESAFCQPKTRVAEDNLGMLLRFTTRSHQFNGVGCRYVSQLVCTSHATIPLQIGD